RHLTHAARSRRAPVCGPRSPEARLRLHRARRHPGRHPRGAHQSGSIVEPMRPGIETLEAALEDWTDWDTAGYYLAVALGLIDPERSPFPTKAKHVFWSDNAVGNALRQFLEKLASLGVLERRDEPDIQYRWNQEYRGTWE